MVQEGPPKKALSFLQTFYKEPLKKDDQESQSKIQKGQLFLSNLNGKAATQANATTFPIFSLAL